MSEPSLHVLILHGPNLNLLGTREPEIYGSATMDEINQALIKVGKEREAEVKCFQSNHEGQLIDWLHEYRLWADGILFNPGAFTHYSYALYDAIVAINKPTIEVHLSNVFKREAWRHKSVITPACVGIISGFGRDSYFMALRELLKLLRQEE
jgi:3-dehydroquinate dehydratase-2